MKIFSDRALERINLVTLLGVCGFALPFGYFGQWPMVLAWLTCFYLWIESDCEMGKRGLHPNGNV